MLFDRKKLRMQYIDGDIICRYGWKNIPRLQDSYLGCRSHFKIGNYWLKAENAKSKIRDYRGSPFTQAQNEVYFHREALKPRDRQYFVELVDHTQLWDRARVHWTLWPVVKLSEKKDSGKLFDRCRRIVQRLVDTYNLSDVITRFNSNWYIVDEKPLIVDVGLADYCRHDKDDQEAQRERLSEDEDCGCDCSECQFLKRQ